MPQDPIWEHGDEDGLRCLRRIICDAHRYMNPNACLILEMGHDQKDEVRKIIEDCRSYDDIAFIKDYSGYHRVVRMRKKRA